MTITFTELAEFLPAGSIEFVGNNQVKLNFNNLTGENLTSLDAGIVKGIAKLLDGLTACTTSINENRNSQNPPLGPIELVTKTLAGTPQAPKFQYSVSIAVDSSSFVNNLIDPTA